MYEEMALESIDDGYYGYDREYFGFGWDRTDSGVVIETGDIALVFDASGPVQFTQKSTTPQRRYKLLCQEYRTVTAPSARPITPTKTFDAQLFKPRDQPNDAAAAQVGRLGTARRCKQQSSPPAG
jgi:hypothetical protein